MSKWQKIIQIIKLQNVYSRAMTVDLPLLGELIYYSRFREMYAQYIIIVNVKFDAAAAGRERNRCACRLWVQTAIGRTRWVRYKSTDWQYNWIHLSVNYLLYIYFFLICVILALSGKRKSGFLVFFCFYWRTVISFDFDSRNDW